MIGSHLSPLLSPLLSLYLFLSPSPFPSVTHSLSFGNLYMFFLFLFRIRKRVLRVELKIIHHPFCLIEFSFFLSVFDKICGPFLNQLYRHAFLSEYVIQVCLFLNPSLSLHPHFTILCFILLPPGFLFLFDMN